MIDIESLDTTSTSTILSISAVRFDPFDIGLNYATEYPTLDILVELDNQEGRSIHEDTLVWWSNQSEEVRNKIFNENGRIPLQEALLQLKKFLWQCSRVWSQGLVLDIGALEHAYKSFGIEVPWRYNIVRDSRTLMDLAEVDIPAPTHDSLEDCFRSIMGIQQVLHYLKIERFHR
jgi:hypothetical protein